jgi:hypothetical protein
MTTDAAREEDARSGSRWGGHAPRLETTIPRHRDCRVRQTAYLSCIEVWAWENAIEKQEYIFYLGEWAPEGVPMNVVGKLR